MLDEPLGALDLKMRQEMQLELKHMHDELGITFIYVTHDQEEALTMSDKIVVLSEGRIQQIGTPEDIYNEPQNAFVAGSCDISSPLRSISPLVGISNPAIILNVVVLPHPDGPRKVTNSPLFTSRLKSSTALNPLSLYTLLICLNSIILSAIVLLLHLVVNLLIQHICLITSICYFNNYT